MSDSNSPPTSPDPNSARPRRASFAAGQSLADMFRSAPRSPPVQSGTSAYPGPITTAAAQANTRRLSVTTLGLSGSPNQTSPFGSIRSRRGSIGSNSIDETAVEDPVGGDSAQSSSPNTPFARRMSFGARALRDRQSNAGQGANGRAPLDNVTPLSSKIPSSPPAASATRGRGEGFSWSENMRTRAERTSMQFGNAGNSAPAGGGIFGGGGGAHGRAQSVATMQPPAQEMPKSKAPDHFQERILKGDFYMD